MQEKLYLLATATPIRKELGEKPCPMQDQLHILHIITLDIIFLGKGIQ